MTGGRKPIYDELAQLVVELKTTITGLETRLTVLEADNQRLREENTEPRRKLGMNPRN